MFVCYRVMPFSLKNAGAIYQRMMNKVFKLLIGHTIKMHVDDMITKSKNLVEHTWHLKETFELLRKYKIFGVSLKKFLRFMLSLREWRQTTRRS